MHMFQNAIFQLISMQIKLWFSKTDAAPQLVTDKHLWLIAASIPQREGVSGRGVRLILS